MSDVADLEIERTKAAILRYQATLDDFARRWRDSGGPCCPACMFGAQYSDVADKLERAREVLVRMLKKRGREEDLRLAEACRVDAWP